MCGVGEIEIDFQCLFEMGDRCVDLPDSGQSDAEIVVSFGQVRRELHAFLVLDDGRGGLSTCGQEDAEVVVGLGIVRIAASTC